MKLRLRSVLSLLLAAILGAAAGAFVFRDAKPRSILALAGCKNCLHPNEVLGLLASAGIRKTPGWIPSVVLETEKAIAVEHPFPSAKHHYVVFPKKDIKNLGELEKENLEHAAECLAVAAQLIETGGLMDYRVWTNGPRRQIISYLHFHVAGS